MPRDSRLSQPVKPSCARGPGWRVEGLHPHRRPEAELVQHLGEDGRPTASRKSGTRTMTCSPARPEASEEPLVPVPCRERSSRLPLVGRRCVAGSTARCPGSWLGTTWQARSPSSGPPEKRDDLGTVDREVDGAPHADVVEGALPGVQGNPVRGRGRGAVHPSRGARADSARRRFAPRPAGRTDPARDREVRVTALHGTDLPLDRFLVVATRTSMRSAKPSAARAGRARPEVAVALRRPAKMGRPRRRLDTAPCPGGVRAHRGTIGAARRARRRRSASSACAGDPRPAGSG